MSNKLSPRRSGKARSQIVRMEVTHEVRKPKKGGAQVRERMAIHTRDNSMFSGGSGSASYKAPIKLAEAHIDPKLCPKPAPNPALRAFMDKHRGFLVPIKKYGVRGQYSYA